MKVYFETLGCPKNVYDTQTAQGILEDNHFEIVRSPEAAEVIVVNTCGFINDAKKESIDRIFEMAAYKEEGKKLVVSGCLSQRYGDELFEEGCNNVCAYCVIPQIRGGYRSKREEDILKEAEELSAAGCRELILIAQDVTYYGMDLYGELRLPQLLRKLCRISGIRWIRLMYCYEDRITDELIKTIAEEEKICNYLDIPLQHASDRVLRAMNRRSTSASIHQTLEKLREAVPDIHIRTTLIVGFPGETEDDYEQLCHLVETEQFARLGVFTYSQEENTPAGEMEGQIDEEIKEQRLDGIMRRQMEISLNQNQEKIGKVFQVMVDEIDQDGSFIGRTRYDAPEIDNAVIFTSDKKHEPGDLAEVLIEDAFDYDIVGREI